MIAPSMAPSVVPSSSSSVPPSVSPSLLEESGGSARMRVIGVMGVILLLLLIPGGLLFLAAYSVGAAA